jgi:molybdate transport system substrate-binding protein
MRRAAPVVGVALLALTACGGSASDDDAGPPAASTDGAVLSGSLTVFAAASLTDVFTELGDQLIAENPQLDVRFNFAGSSALAAQIEQGAPADVFASADEVQMDRVTDAGLADDPQIFAENVLMLAFPPDNPARITQPEGGDVPSLAELVTTDLTMAVCAPEVPCGAAAAEVLESAGLADVPDTFEEDVRAVLAKVELGEVDGGLVYLSDVFAAGDSVLAYAFREAELARNRYPVAVLRDAPNPAAAQAFADLLLSDEGRRALDDARFRPPS